MQARFDNIGGLKVRAPVRSSGVLVGRVAEIHFDNDGDAASAAGGGRLLEESIEYK
mgnify:CR=1 FL=1